jgi:hypothetical protein
MVRRRYPEKEAELAALRDCQMAGVKAGAIAFVAVGGSLFVGMRFYARTISPLAINNVVGVSVGAYTCEAREKTQWREELVLFVPSLCQLRSSMCASCFSKIRTCTIAILACVCRVEGRDLSVVRNLWS